MKLLSELIESPITLTEAEVGGEKRQYISGIFAQAAVPNRNHRIYPLPVLEKEINRYITENVQKNRAFGENGHPTGANVNLDRISIHIKELHKEGTDFHGKALIASTPQGDILKGLLKDGANLGVSTRSLGSLKPLKENLSEVQPDLKLLAIDTVVDPSGPSCFVNGIFEGKEWIFDTVSGTCMEERLDDTKKALKGMTLKQIEEAKLVMFEDFLHGLKVR